MNPLTFILCGGVAGPADAGETAVRLDRRPGGNLYLDEDQLLAPLMARPANALLDLLDIAAYVYAADQAVARGTRRTRDGDRGWRRSFHFVIPVRKPKLWAGAADALADTLGFLSDDDYQFTFRPRGRAGDQRRIRFAHALHVGFDDVALFSGGLDSLAGAARAVADGRQLLLVTHRSITKLAGRQERLLEGLRTLAGDRRPVHLTVCVNKDADLTRENTQRSRSFLYAALGGLIAATNKKDRLLVFENGPLSLNLPLNGAVVGGRATRTTHPRVLAGFARLLSLAAGRPFALDNPFADRTKTDVVRTLVDAGGRDLIRWSTSCVHTWQMSAGRPHCGECSQCIDRRFAVLAAGAEDADPADRYGADLVTGERSAESASLLAGYVEQATEIGRMRNPVQFFARYGEALRALGDGPEPVEQVAERVYRLYRQHAEQVNGVVERALAAHAPAIRERSLPVSSLVRLVCGDPHRVETVPVADPPPAYLFARHAEGWRVRYAGGRELFLVDQKGLGYLQHLLTHPSAPVEVTSLDSARVMRQAEQTNLDYQALADLYRRLREAEADLEDGRTANDPVRLLAAQEELDAIRGRLRADTRPGGRLKRVADEVERQRKRVGVAITRAVERIGEYDPALASHLKEPRLVLGSELVYHPPAGVVWQTD